MLKKIVSIVAVVVLAFSFGACKKKEEKPQLPAGHPPMEGGTPPAGMPPAGMPNMQNVPKVDRKVVVSKDVQAKWKAIKVAVENKAAKTTKEYTVNVGSELAIPDTKIKVKVNAFLPDFKMTDKEIYSASDKPNQPAAQVMVTDSGKEVFNNWLFAMQPGIHPFQHDAIGLVLLGGVAK
jgi:hypothetical protein